MDDILLLDAAERYVKGEMSRQEITFFEELRKNNPDIDQMVVEHTFFLNELNKFSNAKNYKHTLNEVEGKLTEEGFITKTSLKGKAKIVHLWKKYKRTAAVAASIAGIVSIITVGIASMYSGNKTNKDIEQLGIDIKKLKEGQTSISNKIDETKRPKTDPNATLKSGGTGFLIDGKGYLITNAHVLKGKTIIATNASGNQFYAKVCMKDEQRDIAVLKIEDKDFKPYTSLPYGINKTVKLAEPIYTMGYPKDEIVYSEGYLSSQSGYKSDTLTYQIAISAEHGNSGGPVVNKNGDVIGILTDKSEGGAVFAVKSVYIFRAVDMLKREAAYSDIKLTTVSKIKALTREQQVEKVNDCVFLIKSYE